ncbi:hypothetical protein [Methanocorpusculum bavaricum]|jgi:hypothetical protein|uniref:hypothetical protein n=1 Tax=Methanocorpusculum bavaricum TaxID=71518 RepID=UPI0005B29172|nr:hypothetical protein [Methanocorpusculum bavaricum]
MKIDLSGPLYDALKKTTAEYSALIEKNNLLGARKKAAVIVRIYRELADKTPANRKENTECVAKQGIKSDMAHKKIGQARIDITLTAEDKKDVLVVVRGYGEVVSCIFERIDKELKVFLEAE